MTPTRVRRTTGAVALLALVTVTGCGQDEDDYCAALAEEKPVIDRVSEQVAEPGEDVVTPTLESFRRLRDAAPDALRDEWDTVVVAYEALVEVADEVGADLGGYTPGRRPEGLSKAEARRLAGVATQLGSGRVAQAVAGIEDHAAEVCDVNFGGA